MAAFAIVGGSMLATTGAMAASHAAPGAARAVVRAGGTVHHLAGIRRVTSQNWSGFAVHNGTYRSVSASWVEPTGHCGGNSGHDYASFWVGLDGYNTQTVEQTGTDTDCKGSTPKYYAWYEMYPQVSINISHPVKPGDHITASVTYNGGGKFTLKLTDSTRGWTATEHRSLKSAKRGSAEIIVEAPSSETGELPLADFGTIHFTASKVNGASIGRLHPTKITMVDHGESLDKVSGLSGGTSFSATWLHK